MSLLTRHGSGSDLEVDWGILAWNCHIEISERDCSADFNAHFADVFHAPKLAAVVRVTRPISEVSFVQEPPEALDPFAFEPPLVSDGRVWLAAREANLPDDSWEY